eukprot:jgi/Tetstr1/454145/TSEL_041064.t1
MFRPALACALLALLVLPAAVFSSRDITGAPPGCRDTSVICGIISRRTCMLFSVARSACPQACKICVPHAECKDASAICNYAGDRCDEEAVMAACPATCHLCAPAPATPEPEPTTAPPATPEATTAAPATPEPTTAAPATPEPTTAPPATPEPTTAPPATPEPTTAAPATPEPTTAAPATPEPTTAAPATPEPTTAAPATPEPEPEPTATPGPEPTAAAGTGCADTAETCSSLVDLCDQDPAVAEACPASCGVCDEEAGSLEETPNMETCTDVNPLCTQEMRCDVPLVYEHCPVKCTGQCDIMPDMDFMTDRDGTILIIPCKTCAVQVFIGEDPDAADTP